jgi:hypothetical protein
VETITGIYEFIWNMDFFSQAFNPKKSLNME